jgi:hypothetical protein
MSSMPVAEGGRARGNTKPNWLLLGGLGVGAVILILMFTRGSGSTDTEGKTTAAGTSINAALGDIQFENMQIQGHIGETEQRLRQQMDANTNSILAGQDSILGNIHASDEWTKHLSDRASILFSTGWDIQDPIQANHWLAGDRHPGDNLDFTEYSNAPGWWESFTQANPKWLSEGLWGNDTTGYTVNTPTTYWHGYPNFTPTT